MKKAPVVLLIGLIAFAFSDCGGASLKKFADNQKAAQLKSTKGRVIIDGTLIEPLYDIVIGNPTGKQYDAIVYLNKIKVFPTGTGTTQSICEKYVEMLKQEIGKESLIIINTQHTNLEKPFQVKDLARWDQIKSVLASSMTDEQKYLELTGIVRDQPLAREIVAKNK
jgi:hypothetical protein